VPYEFSNPHLLSISQDEIRRRWAEFLEKDLSRINGVLKGEQWIWESADPNDVT